MTTIIMLEISIILFKDNSPSELNLISTYFSSYTSEFLFNDLLKSLFLLQISAIFLIFSLLSLEGTSINYLFLLTFSKYLFTLLKIRYKGFTLLIFTYFKSLIITYPLQ